MDRCVDLVTNVIDRKHPDYDWSHFPVANVPMFTSILKALTRYKMKSKRTVVRNESVIDHASCWQIVEWCLQCMDALELERDAVVYGNLIHLCGDLFGNADLEKAMAYYLEMKGKGIKVGNLQIMNLLKTGEQYHHHNKNNNAERKGFIQFVLHELEEQDIAPSVYVRKTVTRMLGASGNLK